MLKYLLALEFPLMKIGPMILSLQIPAQTITLLKTKNNKIRKFKQTINSLCICIIYMETFESPCITSRQ